MRYSAIDERDHLNGAYAAVTGPNTSTALALRHARAMKAVLLAARAWKRAWAAALKKPEALRVADRRLVAAQERLEKIEKEVSRG